MKWNSNDKKREKGHDGEECFTVNCTNLFYHYGGYCDKCRDEWAKENNNDKN
jgi:hypothetical protein